MSVTRLVWIPLLVGCATVSTPIPEAWKRVPEAPKIRAVQLAADGTVRTVALALEPPSAAPTVLTDAVAEIQSFDVSATRKEVVFSAKRESGFDIGLIALEGSPISWVPHDPADEVMAQWSPRGSRISYVVRARGGDYVRAVHVPTSFAFTHELPYGRAQTLGWDTVSERYAVAWNSVDASDRVEVMRWNEDVRRMAVPPAVKLAVDVEPVGPDALLLRPRDMRYGEKLPLVVWLTDDRNAWDDARAALLQNARVACLVATRMPDLAALKDRDWIDLGRTFVVGGEGGTTAIVGSSAVRPGTYRAQGQTVLVPPTSVKSFAAGFIADQLKGNPPPNGSSR